MMFTCASCNSQHTEGPICSICKRHYDYQCSGITENGYRKLGDRKNHWRCLKCKASPSPSPIATSPQPVQMDKIQEQLSKIMLDLAPLASLVSDVKEIKNEITGLKESIEMAHELIGNFSGMVKTLEARINQIEKVANEVPQLRSEVDRLNRELQEKDQWARANNVEIRGVPQKKTENLYDLAQKISTLCHFSIRKEDINYIARIPTRAANTEKPIVICFNSRYTKEEFVASYRQCKHLNLSQLGFSSNANFYVNDHLTTANKILLSKARALAKEKNFQYIWVKHCKIMARRSDTSPVFFIKCEKDLLKISP